MFGLLFERTRKVRHVLDAWCLLPACLLVGGVPLIGLPVGLGLGFIGIFAAFRLAGYGMVFQCFLLSCLYCISGGLILVGNLAFVGQGLNRFLSIEAHLPRSFDQPAWESRFVPQTPMLPVTPPLSTSGVSATTTSLPQPSHNHVASAPAPHPPIQPRRRDLFEEAKSVAQTWFNARNKRDLTDVMELCDDQIEVSGQSVLRGELVDKISKLDETYLADQEVNTETPYIVPVADDQWRVTYRISYFRPAVSDGFPIRGQRLRTILLRDDGEKFRISADFHKPLPPLDSPQTMVSGVEGRHVQTLVASCVASDLAGDLETGMSCYAPQVRYFDELRNHQEIRLDKEQYAKRWPRRMENFDGLLILESLPDQRILARFGGMFRSESPERGEWSGGIIEHRFVVARNGNRLQIVDQSGKVSDAAKGKLETEENE